LTLIVGASSGSGTFGRDLRRRTFLPVPMRPERGLDMSELLALDAHDLRAGYMARRFSPTEVMEQVGQRIESTRHMNAFVAVRLEAALVEAKRITTGYLRGDEHRPLAGIPLAVKDIIDTADLVTACGSSIFRDRRPACDAAVVARARRSGAIVIGKTNTHEFAWGITTDNPHFGACRNPWDPERTPGGSSGGSAVAVATGAVPLAFGTDTGGSIRIPAAFCGVFGFKPTFGIITTDGVFPLAPSLDHVGVISRTPRDARLLLAAVATERADRLSAAVPALRRLRPHELRIGRCVESQALSEDLAFAFSRILTRLEQRGATVIDVALPPAPEGAFATIQGAEAYHVHSQLGLFPARGDEYGSDVRERLERSATIALDEYLSAAEERNDLRAAWRDALQAVDVIVSPVSPGQPPLRGTSDVLHQGESHDFRALVMPHTVSQDLTGLPACSVPLGLDRDGLPLAVQLSGRHGDEATLIELAEILVDAACASASFAGAVK
jgi:aspartyl-tRNA(Asn)/glutamyl-tRNA(Gln) amidotransferase subunit A